MAGRDGNGSWKAVAGFRRVMSLRVAEIRSHWKGQKTKFNEFCLTLSTFGCVKTDHC